MILAIETTKNKQKKQVVLYLRHNYKAGDDVARNKLQFFTVDYHLPTTVWTRTIDDREKKSLGMSDMSIMGDYVINHPKSSIK